MSIGFPTGDWCRSPSFAKTTPNMFKGRLNRGERSAPHNRRATYISASHLASFSARWVWEKLDMFLKKNKLKFEIKRHNTRLTLIPAPHTHTHTLIWITFTIWNWDWWRIEGDLGSSLQRYNNRKRFSYCFTNTYVHIRPNLQTGSSIFKLLCRRIEDGTVFSINWSTDCRKKGKFNEQRRVNRYPVT